MTVYIQNVRARNVFAHRAHSERCVKVMKIFHIAQTQQHTNYILYTCAFCVTCNDTSTPPETNRHHQHNHQHHIVTQSSIYFVEYNTTIRHGIWLFKYLIYTKGFSFNFLIEQPAIARQLIFDITLARECTHWNLHTQTLRWMRETRDILPNDFTHSKRAKMTENLKEKHITTVYIFMHSAMDNTSGNLHTSQTRIDIILGTESRHPHTRTQTSCSAGSRNALALPVATGEMVRNK